MSYEPTIWKKGDKVTSTKLNKIENGIQGNDEEITSIKENLTDKAPVITETASGSIASFSDGADNLLLKSLVVNINPVQDLHGQDAPYPSYTPYSNICPISGWTGCEVDVAGVNLLPNEKYQLSNLNVIIGQADAAYRTYLKAGTYTISAKSNAQIGIFYRKSDGASNIRITQTSDMPIGTFTVTDDGYYRFWAYNLNGVDANDIEWFQLELGNIATDYEPYNGTTYPISWQTEAGTVYGGTVDLVSGVLTVTHGYIASYNGETLPSTWISDRDVYAVGTTPTTGAQVVYRLAEVQTYQLTPNQINSFYGANNMWADSGDTEVEYRADTKLYIERLTAPDSADMIADANITSGKYFMVGNSLYKATANIANGSAIVVGTNCTRKSLSEALNEINA